MREREGDLRTFVDEEESHINDESDVELDGNDQLDLDLEIENTILLHSSPTLEFFKLFITYDFVSKMAEQTNFYAVQRGAPRSFKPWGHKFIPLHEHPHRQWDKARDNFWVFPM